MDDGLNRSFECTTESISENGFNIPGWTLESLIDAVDAYDLNYGDRATSSRIQSGKTVTWIINLDDSEIGRVMVSPSESLAGYSYSIRYTENSRTNAGDTDASAITGISLFYEIADDLEEHLFEYRGIRKRPQIRPARPKFWRQSINQKIESEKADRNKGGAQFDPIYDTAWNEMKSSALTIGQAYQNYLQLNGFKHSKGEKDKFRNAMNYRDRKAR